MSKYNRAAVTTGLSAPYTVDFHDRIGSTNDRARTLAASGRSGVVVIAAEQTSGRGRRGRSWAGPRGGVYLSIVLDPSLAAADTPLLTLGAGVATARAVREAGVPAGLKWPNDVVVRVVDGRAVDPGTAGNAGEERKLAGILTERTHGLVVVGIGLNANLSAGDLPAGATTMRDLVGPVDRVALVQRILAEVHELTTDPDTILPAWRDLATTLGRRVRVSGDAGEIVGTAIDVEHPGRLVLDTPDGRERIAVGDCEHLRPV